MLWPLLALALAGAPERILAEEDHQQGLALAARLHAELDEGEERRALAVQAAELAYTHDLLDQAEAWLSRVRGDPRLSEPLRLKVQEVDGGMAYLRGDYAAAIAHFEGALASRAVTEKDELRIRHNLALSLADQGRYAEAEDTLVRVQALEEALLGPDHHHVLHTLTTRASIALDAQAFERALLLAEEALARAERAGIDGVRRAQLMEVYASASWTLDRDRAGALAMEDAAVALFTEVLGSRHRETANARVNRALMRRDAGDYDGATADLQLAAEVLLDDELVHPVTKGRLLTELAAIDFHFDRDDAALQTGRQAVELLRPWAEVVPAILVNALDTLAFVLAHAGRVEESLPLLDEAVDVARGDVDHSWLINARVHRSRARGWAGRQEEALAEQRTLWAEPELTGTDLLEVGQALTHTLGALGRREEAREVLGETLAYLEQRQEELLTQVGDRERRAMLFEHRVLVDLMIELDPPGALAHLLRHIHLSSAVTRRLAPSAEERRRLQSKRHDLASLTLDVELPSEERRAAIAATRLELDTIERALVDPPSLASPSAEELCAALPENGALVVTFVHRPTPLGEMRRSTSTRLLAWVATSGHCPDQPVDIGHYESMERDIVLARDSAAVGELEPLHDLVASLLGPLDTSPSRTWIVPAASLWTVPWGAVEALSSGQVALLPSPAGLLESVPPAAGPAVLLAGVEPNPERSGPCGGELPSTALPGALGEVRALQPIVGRDSTLLLGEEATEAGLTAAAEGAGLLHLATHSFDASACDEGDEDSLLSVSAFSPMSLSGLVLTPEGPDDGLLTGEEVAGLRLQPGALVVLSACHTGTAPVIKLGAGVLGLGRGFTAAGASAVVQSLWSVPDEATRMMMLHLHRRLRRGDSPALALRRAQRRARRRGARGTPEERGAWASWVVVGPGALPRY